MYQERTKEELAELLTDLRRQYADVQKQELRLDMSRGKPGTEQMGLSAGLLEAVGPDSSFLDEDGADCRNYGGLGGIPEAKRLMAALLEVEPDQVFVGGGSSLNLMHDLMTFCWLHSLPGSQQPWCRLDKVKFLCPSPGYDRHFAVTAHFGIENIPVPMTPDGPDMDVVERLVAGDPSIKGMWCVPKYSNPTGVTFSSGTVERLAAMKTAAGDFRIFWDNAYAIHDLYEDGGDTLLPLLPALEAAGNGDRGFLFGSFAKITFGGGGIAATGMSRENLAWVMKHMAVQTICADKVNQLRHVRYFGDMEGMRAHMKRHAAVLRPKFQVVEEVLSAELGGLGIASWTRPRGGYFVSFDTLPGCAKRVVALCREAGVILTPAGATYPGGVDPEDRNIRIAPSFPAVEELRRAAGLLALCTKIASAEALLA